MGIDKNPNDYYPTRSKWVRVFYAIVILFGYGFSEAILWILTVIQILSVVFRADQINIFMSFPVV